jgi:hypothetical protein
MIALILVVSQLLAGSNLGRSNHVVDNTTRPQRVSYVLLQCFP